jgi:hypothetical protein
MLTHLYSFEDINLEHCANMVELGGLEPPTSSMPLKRSPS